MLEWRVLFILALAVVGCSVTPSLGANEVKWGLPDAVAVAGQLFEYELKKEDLTQYKVTEEDIRLLPDWIKWNQEKKRFEGFATSELIGQETKIRVTSTDKDTATDTFLVKVVQFKMGDKYKNVLNQNQNKLNSSTVETVHCPFGFSVTTSTVLIDADWGSLTPTQCINLIYKMSTYLGLPSDALRLNAAKETHLLDANALVAGPGNVVQPKHKGILCQWEVGCGNVLGSHMPVLELLEVASFNGSIAEVVGVDVVGWHITNNKPKSKRLKRHAYLFQNYHTPTPVPVYPPPSRYPQSIDNPESAWLAPKIEITISTKAGTLHPKPTKTQDPWSTATRPILPTDASTERKTTHWPDATSQPGEIYPSVEVTRTLPPHSSSSLPPYTTQLPASSYTTTKESEWTSTRPDEWETKPPPTGLESTRTTTSTIDRLEPGRTTEPTDSSEWLSSDWKSTSDRTSTSDWEQYYTAPDWESTWTSTKQSPYPTESSTSTWETTATTQQPPYPTDDWKSSWTTSQQSSTDYWESTRTTPQRSSTDLWEGTSSSTDTYPYHTTEGDKSSDIYTTSDWYPSSIVTSEGPTPEGPTPTPQEKPLEPGSDGPPRVLIRLSPIEIKAGESLQYKIPSDTFFDMEDGYTETLQLSLTTEFGQSPSWLKLNKTSQIVYGLPLNDNAGIYYYYVTATDSRGQSAKTELEVTVIESELAEKQSNEFSVTLDVPYDRFVNDLDFRLSVLNKLGQAFGDKDGSKITLTEVSPGSVVIRWTNNSLPEDSCPNDDIIALQKLMVNPDGTLNEQFARKMEPYRITGATSEPIEPCRDVEKPSKPDHLDAHPMVSRQLAPLSVKAGQVLWFRIPRDTFYDEEDGFTDNLKLLFSEFDRSLPPTTWLNMNESTQTIYGLPLTGSAGAYVYYLVALDSKEQIAKTPLKINVTATEDKLTHEFSLTLDVPYEKFVNELDFRLSVVNKIGQAFGDADASKLRLTKVSPGSTEISWTNSSLPTDICPTDEIIALHNNLISDGALNDQFVKKMEPYKVIKASGTPLGPCALEIPTEPEATAPTVEPEGMTSVDPDQRGPQRSAVASVNTLVYVVIAIVILVVLLLVCIILCILFYKKKRQRQQKQEETDKVSGSHKGIPIIFADELEETPPPGAESDEATPASTLKSKKDLEIIETVPPPEYPKSKAGSTSSTLKSDIKKPLLSDSENETTDGDTLPKRGEFESSTLPAR